MISIASSALLIALSTFIGTSTAQGGQTLCEYNDYLKTSKALNATGTLTVPGLQLKSDANPVTWNFTRLVDYTNTGGNASLTTGITLLPSKGQNLTSETVGGCMFTPDYITLNRAQTLPIIDDGTCSTFLGSSCLAIINKGVNAILSKLSDDDEACTTYNGAVKAALADPACSSNWDADWGTLGESLDLENPDIGCTEGQEDLGLLVHEITDTNYNVSTSDFTIYDIAVGAPLPVFVVAWEQDGKSLSNVMCIPANNTVDGSRAAAAAPSPTNTPSSTTASSGGGGTSTSPTASASSTNKPSSAGRVEMSFGVGGLISVAVFFTFIL